jgi:hypothetical protein
MSTRDLQLVSDDSGRITAVIVPIETWKEITSQIETNYLVKSTVMKRRLQAAMRGGDAVSFDDAIQNAELK